MPYYINHLPPNNKKTRKLPSARHQQIWENSKKLCQEIIYNLSLPLWKNYIDSFHIPKGEDDIHMVLSGTSCGLKDALFAPIFWLPYSDTITQRLHFGYKAVDLDIGECFLDCNLYQELFPYSGIDLTLFQEELIWIFHKKKN